MGGEAAVKDLTARFQISQPAVSQHLGALKHAGLVTSRRAGRCVYYRADPAGLQPLIDWIAHYRAFWATHLERLVHLLEAMDP
jgi:DNA-binding transcriptional ArsR family regulator